MKRLVVLALAASVSLLPVGCVQGLVCAGLAVVACAAMRWAP